MTFIYFLNIPFFKSSQNIYYYHYFLSPHGHQHFDRELGRGQNLWHPHHKYRREQGFQSKKEQIKGGIVAGVRPVR